MSLTGNDVLALIERTLTDTRSEIGTVDTRLARSTAELERLKQAEIGCLSVLAKMRLREIEGATVVGVARRDGRERARAARGARGRAGRGRRGDRARRRATQGARAGARRAARRRRRG